jgi:hypothetical protein
MVHIKLLLHAALLGGKRRLLFVFVVVIHIERRSRLLYNLRLLMLHDFQRIIVLELICGTEEATLFSDELVKILLLSLFISMLTAKGRHASIEGVHCPGHRIDKYRLIWICKAIYLVG